MLCSLALRVLGRWTMTVGLGRGTAVDEGEMNPRTGLRQEAPEVRCGPMAEHRVAAGGEEGSGFEG